MAEERRSRNMPAIAAAESDAIEGFLRRGRRRWSAKLAGRIGKPVDASAALGLGVTAEVV